MLILWVLGERGLYRGPRAAFSWRGLISCLTLSIRPACHSTAYGMNLRPSSSARFRYLLPRSNQIAEAVISTAGLKEGSYPLLSVPFFPSFPSFRHPDLPCKPQLSRSRSPHLCRLPRECETRISYYAAGSARIFYPTNPSPARQVDLGLRVVDVSCWRRCKRQAEAHPAGRLD